MTTRKLDVSDIERMATAIQARRSRFGNDEPFVMSFGVVLMNYGDGSTTVRCTQGEWSGIKSDLRGDSGLPLCPNGHPLFEGSGRQVLALIDEDRTWTADEATS